MKKIYSSQDRLMTGHMKNMLENEEIECVIKNEHLSSILGEIPPIECWTEVWIVDDSQYDRAVQIVEKALAHQEETPQSDWICPQCSEELEGQFTECWNCGASRE